MATINCSITDTADATFAVAGVAIDTPVVSYADATAAILLGVTLLIADSTGNAVSTVTAQDRTNLLVSTANATATPSLNAALVELLTSRADARGFNFNQLQTVALSATANATATPTLVWNAPITVYANARSTPNFVLGASYSAHANAQSSFLFDGLVFALTNTANATSAFANSNNSTLAVAETANATAAITPDFHSTAALESRAAASSVLSTSLVALNTFRARANVTSRVIEALDRSALWMNTETTAGTHFIEYPFNSFAIHGGYAIAAGDGGIYLLEGDNDAGVDIVADVRTDNLDFDTAQLKHLDGLIVAGVTDAPLQVTVTSDQDSYTYLTHLASAPTQRNNRAQLGRGLRSTYFRFGISNPDGDDFDVDNVKLTLGESKRSR